MKNGLFCSKCKKRLGNEFDTLCGIAISRFAIRKGNGGQEYLCIKCVEELGIMEEFGVRSCDVESKNMSAPDAQRFSEFMESWPSSP